MKKILLAVDGSQYGLEAAKFLAHLPHDGKVEICVVSALFVRGGTRPYVMGNWVEACLEQDHKEAERAFAAIENIFAGANVTLSHIIRKGHPGETIVQIAQEVASELLVIGAKGHSALDRLLLGSTSDYVATHAPCSVLVVRPSDMMDTKRAIHVAIGYEPTGPAQAAVEEFSEFQWGMADVRLLNVSDVSGFYDESYREQSKHDIETAVADIRDVAPNARGEWLEDDHIGEALVRYTEENSIDVIFMGESPRSRLGRVLMGSMTRFVLRHAPCSVWITRNRMIHGVSKQKPATTASRK